MQRYGQDYGMSRREGRFFSQPGMGAFRPTQYTLPHDRGRLPGDEPGWREGGRGARGRDLWAEPNAPGRGAAPGREPRFRGGAGPRYDVGFRGGFRGRGAPYDRGFRGGGW